MVFLLKFWKKCFFLVPLVNTLICLRCSNCENHVIFHTSGCSLHSTFQKLGKQVSYFLVSIQGLNIVCCPSRRLGCKYCKAAFGLKTDCSISSESFMERGQKSVFTNDECCKLKNINKTKHFNAISLVFFLLKYEVLRSVSFFLSFLFYATL